MISSNVCALCGRIQPQDGVCTLCQASPPPYIALRSCALYQPPLSNALKKLKYAGDITLGEALARMLVKKLSELGWQIDIVTAVPAGVARQAQRGYNQAHFLAMPLALAFGLPYQPYCLEKVRQTPSQVGLSFQQRRNNVAGAFRANHPKRVHGKNVLLVDDIATSGATAESCATALMDAGALGVYVLTLARAASAEMHI